MPLASARKAGEGLILLRFACETQAVCRDPRDQRDLVELLRFLNYGSNQSQRKAGRQRTACATHGITPFSPSRPFASLRRVAGAALGES